MKPSDNDTMWPFIEIGATKTLRVRIEPIDYFGSSHTTTLLYASDLHLTPWSRHVTEQLCQVVHQMQPQVVLLGGDLVDMKRSLPLLSTSIRQLGQVCPVWAVAGNHDAQVGTEMVRHTVKAAGGNWLEADRSFVLNNGRHQIRIDGGCQRSTNPTPYSILCAHDPAIFHQAVEHRYSLVLAGHLHGSQWVLAERKGRLYPGAWFYRWNGDKFHEGQTTMLVSRGVNDTLPVRWNCPRDVIVCQIS